MTCDIFEILSSQIMNDVKRHKYCNKIFNLVATGQCYDCTCPDLVKAETEAAIARLKRNEAPGVDSITAEELQVAGPSSLDLMYDFWSEEKFPSAW